MLTRDFIRKALTVSGVGFFLFSFHLSFAFENTPEFQALTEDEADDFEGPIRLNPEYSSDFLAYLKPDRWRYLWISQTKGLEISAGSTSARHFKMDNRLKIHQLLNPWLEFRFNYFDDSSQERSSTHTYLEMIAWPRPGLGLGVYGELSMAKAQDDTGVALFFRPGPRHEIRLYQTFVDVARLRRNEKPNTYLEPELPRSRGVVGRLWSDPGNRREEFVEYSLRYEPRTSWRFPETEHDYRYWKMAASLDGSKHLSERLQFFSRLQWDRKFESKEKLSSTSSVASQAWVTTRFFWLNRMRILQVGPDSKWELTPGFLFSYRNWHMRNVSGPGKGIYRDILPHATLRIPVSQETPDPDVFEIGYEMTFHGEAFSGSIPLSQDLPNRDATYEHRLNLVQEFNFSATASLRLMATADLDHALSKNVWQGGCGQLRVTF